VLERYEQQVISHSALLSELAGYARPNDKISELVRVGALTRLKKGLYTLSDNPQLSLGSNKLLQIRINQPR